MKKEDEELHTMLDSTPNLTTEEVRDLYEEIVEGFKVLGFSREDSWNADWTIAQIAHPLLKQLQETKHGAPRVDDEDVPEELRSTSCAPKENEWDTDDNWFKRYEYVLDEIIFAMQEVANNYENEPEMFEKVREMVFGEIDPKTMTGELDTGIEIIPSMAVLNKAYHERIQNGLMLFGVFFTSLWT